MRRPYRGERWLKVARLLPGEILHPTPVRVGERDRAAVLVGPVVLEHDASAVWRPVGVDRRAGAVGDLALARAVGRNREQLVRPVDLLGEQDATRQGLRRRGRAIAFTLPGRLAREPPAASAITRSQAASRCSREAGMGRWFEPRLPIRSQRRAKPVPACCFSCSARSRPGAAICRSARRPTCQRALLRMPLLRVEKIVSRRRADRRPVEEAPPSSRQAALRRRCRAAAGASIGGADRPRRSYVVEDRARERRRRNNHPPDGQAAKQRGHDLAAARQLRRGTRCGTARRWEVCPRTCCTPAGPPGRAASSRRCRGPRRPRPELGDSVRSSRARGAARHIRSHTSPQLMLAQYRGAVRSIPLRTTARRVGTCRRLASPPATAS